MIVRKFVFSSTISILSLFSFLAYSEESRMVISDDTTLPLLIVPDDAYYCIVEATIHPPLPMDDNTNRLTFPASNTEKIFNYILQSAHQFLAKVSNEKSYRLIYADHLNFGGFLIYHDKDCRELEYDVATFSDYLSTATEDRSPALAVTFNMELLDRDPRIVSRSKYALGSSIGLFRSQEKYDLEECVSELQLWGLANGPVEIKLELLRFMGTVARAYGFPFIEISLINDHFYFLLSRDCESMPEIIQSFNNLILNDDIYGRLMLPQGFVYMGIKELFEKGYNTPETLAQEMIIDF